MQCFRKIDLGSLPREILDRFCVAMSQIGDRIAEFYQNSFVLEKPDFLALSCAESCLRLY